LELTVDVWVGALGRYAVETRKAKKLLVINECDLEVKTEGIWNVETGGRWRDE
jgi:hypothetical protein